MFWLPANIEDCHASLGLNAIVRPVLFIITYGQYMLYLRAPPDSGISLYMHVKLLFSSQSLLWVWQYVHWIDTQRKTDILSVYKLQSVFDIQVLGSTRTNDSKLAASVIWDFQGKYASITNDRLSDKLPVSRMWTLNSNRWPFSMTCRGVVPPFRRNELKSCPAVLSMILKLKSYGRRFSISMGALRRNFMTG